MAELSEKEQERVGWVDRANIERLEMAQAMVRPTAVQRRKHEPRRAASRKCKACYYLRNVSISGAAFTDFTCQICIQPKRHPNTGVPKYCAECCAEHELCQNCGGRLQP
jgi:hypothetical protein